MATPFWPSGALRRPGTPPWPGIEAQAVRASETLAGVSDTGTWESKSVRPRWTGLTFASFSQATGLWRLRDVNDGRSFSARNRLQLFCPAKMMNILILYAAAHARAVLSMSSGGVAAKTTLLAAATIICLTKPHTEHKHQNMSPPAPVTRGLVCFLACLRF